LLLKVLSNYMVAKLRKRLETTKEKERKIWK